MGNKALDRVQAAGDACAFESKLRALNEHAGVSGFAGSLRKLTSETGGRNAA